MTLQSVKPQRFDDGLERVSPQNLDAERAVLGAILLDSKNLKIAGEQLTPSDFFGEQNKRIFRHMLEMDSAQQAIDLVTLYDFVERKGDLESCGGNGYIAQLVDGVPRVSHVEHYARIVKEKATLRVLIHAACTMQQDAFDGTEDPGVLLTRATETLARITAGQASGCNGYREVFHSFEDFEHSPTLSASIDGFLFNDAATMIGGLSGHAKTFAMLSTVKALLAGKGTRLRDTFQVMETAARVLYLIPESTIGPFKHRLQLFGLYDCLRPEDGRLLVRTLSKGPTPCLSDPRILFAAKGAHVFLDTAVRFSTEGDENSASDNQRGLATDIFKLLESGARCVVGAHHAPKPFAKENVMRLENVLRGSGDVGAMLATCWAIKQLDAAQNIVHVECVKARDFQAVGPFQLIGRPFIDQTGDFSIHKRPGECGSLQDEQQPDRDRGGAPVQVREARSANIALLREWLNVDRNQTSEQLVRRFADAGISVAAPTVRKYKMELDK